MKIYNKVVIDMATMETEFEDSFEYEGEVCLCKSGGGGSTVDKEYNKTMAAQSERQLQMVEEMMGYYKEWALPLDAATQQAQMDILPYQSAYETGQYQSALELIPHQTALERDRIESERTLIPGQTALQGEQIGAARQLLPGQTGLSLEQTEAARQLLPGQTALTSDQIAAQRQLLPGQTALTEEQIATQRRMMPQHEQTQSQFLTAARQGISGVGWADRAQAGVQQQATNTLGQMQRHYAGMGIDPSSGNYQKSLGQASTQMARALGGARSDAFQSAEQESFKRLQAGAGLGGGY